MPEEQSRLSELCTLIIGQYFDSDLIKKEDEDKFWESLKKFHEEIFKVKARYNLENLPDEVEKFKINIETLKRNENEALDAHLIEEARSIGNTIRRNYIKFITIVAQIKEKALRIDERKSLDTELSWASIFLTKYYQVIAVEGSLDDIVKLMEAQLSTMDEPMIRGSFTRQKTRLGAISKEINYLKGVNGGFPVDLKQRVSSIDTRIADLLGLYSKEVDLNTKADQILEVHEMIKKELQELYEDTIKRSIAR